jgi:biopolymer transport protein ExbD
MAMDVGSKNSLKADINVTPLVDVMLVLLIIMMLIAPMIRSVPVALPAADNARPKPDTQEQTVVAIDARSNFFVNLMPVTTEELVPSVRRALEDKDQKVVYVQGDRDVQYSAVMAAMDALRQARVGDIALITEPKPGATGRIPGR